MIELLHKGLLWVHIPAGFISLILFWIPVGVKKGSPVHRKVGRYYYACMWVVLISAALLSVCNTILGNYVAAAFLGYLSILTSYPLWYSYEILNQKLEWTDRYFYIRKTFVTFIFLAGVGMILLGGIGYRFLNMGTTMAFFGILGLSSAKDVFMSKEKAMNKENKMKMHIQGTIISGIAAYTAFFAFGGARIMVGYFHVDAQWMVVPWVLPTILGVTYSRYMKRKYKVVGRARNPVRQVL